MLKPDSIMELGEYFGMDGPKLWNELVSYKVSNRSSLHGTYIDGDSATLQASPFDDGCPREEGWLEVKGDSTATLQASPFDDGCPREEGRLD